MKKISDIGSIDQGWTIDNLTPHMKGRSNTRKDLAVKMLDLIKIYNQPRPQLFKKFTWIYVDQAGKCYSAQTLKEEVGLLAQTSRSIIAMCWKNPKNEIMLSYKKKIKPNLYAPKLRHEKEDLRANDRLQQLAEGRISLNEWIGRKVNWGEK